MIRAFLAIELSPDIRQKVSSFQQQLKDILPSMNWIRPESIHVTLKFLGSVELSRIPQLMSVLEPIGDKTSPFSLDLQGVGVFPTVKRPRIFWLGVSGPSQSLHRLVSEVEAALQSLGFASEEKTYHPHLTLARIKHENAMVGSALIEKGVFENGHHLGTLTVDRFTLFQSDLNTSGALYTPLGTVLFSPDSLD